MHEFIAHYSYLVLLAKKVVDLVYSVVVDLGENWLAMFFFNHRWFQNNQLFQEIKGWSLLMHHEFTAHYTHTVPCMSQNK